MSDFVDALKRFSPVASGSEDLTMSTMVRDRTSPLAPPPAPPAPVAPVDPALAASMSQLDQAIQDPRQMDLLNVSRQRDNNLTRDNVLIQDWNNLSPGDFFSKYGQQTYDKMVKAHIAGARVHEVDALSRNTGQIAGDTAIAAGSGAVQSLGGLAVAGLGLVSDEAGVRASEALNGIQDFTNNLQSDALNRRRYVDSLRSTLDSRDSADQFEKDKATDGSFVAGLKNIGRGVVSGTKRMVEDPTLAANMVAEGAGSMLVAGPAAKGLQAAKVASKLAFPLVVGAMEGGSAYTQAAQEIMAIPDAELLQQSPTYRELRQGLSEQDAKVELASTAGLTAEAITAPVAAATGKLVERIEMNPLKAAWKAPAEAVGNVARETVEEGIQSGTSQMATNIGMQDSGADPKRGLTEGVGDAAIQGAVAGAGSAGAISAPGAALHGVGMAGKTALDNLSARADAIRAENNSASSVSAENVRAGLDEAKVAAPAVAEAVSTLAQEAVAAAPEEHKEAVQTEADAFVAKLTEATQITPQEIEEQPAELKGLFKNPDGSTKTDVLDVLMEAARVANDPKSAPEQAGAAGLFLLKNVDALQNFLGETPDFLKNVPHDRSEYDALKKYQDVLNAVQQVPEIQQTAKNVEASLEITPEESTAPTQQTVDKLVKLAQLRPEQVPVEVYDTILNHDKNKTGDITLTPEYRRLLTAARSLMASVAEGKKISGTDFLKKAIEIGGKGSKGKSLKGHFDAIVAPIMRGDLKAGRDAAQALARFAQSHRNKVAALNKSIANGDGQSVAYETFSPDGKRLPADGKFKVGVTLGSKNSEAFARQVYAEAVALSNLANGFARSYPAFGLNEIAIPELNLGENNQNISSNTSGNTETAEGSTPASSEAASTATTQSEPAQTEQQTEPSAQKTETKDEGSKDPQPAQPQAQVQVQEQAQEAKSPEAEPAQGVASQAEDKTQETPSAEAKPDEGSKGQAEAEAVSVRAETRAETRSADTSTVQKTSEAFPGLVQPKGKNRFHLGFKFPAFGKQISRALESLNPLADAFKALDAANLNDTQVAAYGQLGAKAREAFKVLKERLETSKPFAQLTDPEKEPTRYMNGRALNIVEENNGKPGYNNQLMQGAMMAGLDWLINGQVDMAPQDPDELAKDLGFPYPVPGMVDAFRGMTATQAKEALASKILEFWGLEKNQNEALANTDGVLQGIAAELLMAFEQTGLIKINKVEQFFHVTGKTYNMITFERDEKTAKIFNNLAGAKDFLANWALIEPPARGISVGEPITKVADTQLRNKPVKLTRQQRQAIEREQKRPYWPNLLVADFIAALAPEAFVDFQGGRQDLDKLNKNHLESVKGKNQGLLNAFQNVLDQMANVRAQALAKGLSPEDVASYYQHEITRVGRLQMMGLTNPQSDKLAREIFMPTRSVLDLTDAKQRDFFWLTVAQGLGVKTEQDTRAVAVAKAQAQIQGQYRAIVDELKTWEQNRSKKVSADLLARINQAYDPKGQKQISMHGLHSLLAVARLENTPESGLAKFTHFNYVEADGKTNGPINSLMLLATGEFSSAWLKAVGKGGAYFGNFGANGKSLNAHSDKVDLYQEGAIAAKGYIGAIRNELKRDHKAIGEHMDRLFRLMRHLNADITIENGELVIKRGATKNPLTITIYGSGVKGIAGKVTGEIVDAIYEKMSEFSTTNKDDIFYKEFVDDLTALTNQKAVKSLKGKWHFFTEPHGKGFTNDPVEFTFAKEQFETLQTNIQTFFVNPMADAIDETVMGHVRETTGAIQEATQIQSIVMRALFRRAIIARMLSKRQDNPNYDPNDFLSEKELQDILTKLLPDGPLFSTGTQSYFVGGSERSGIFGNAESVTVNGQKLALPKTLGMSLDEKLRTDPRVYAPDLAGVSGIPFLVIGSGDGQMMLNAATDEKIDRVLKVFDGMNMPADQIEHHSRLINQHVHETWTTNPMRALAEAFAKFAQRQPFDDLFNNKNELNNLENITPDVIKEMSKVIFHQPEPENLVTPEMIKNHITQTVKKLNHIADSIDARQEVFRQFPMSIDQMASGESPYVHSGSIQIAENATEDQILEAMNRAYQEALGNKVAEPKPEIDAVPVEGILGAEGEFTTLQQEFLDASLQALKGLGYRILTGTPAQVDLWLQQNNADRYQPGMLDNSNGFVDPVSKLIVVVGGNETLVHELIHSATFQKVAAYYADSNNVSDIEKQAIRNIEGLMNQFLGLAVDTEDETLRSDWRMAQDAIQGHLAKSNPAAAVNEFMAWVLANQGLAETLDMVKAKESAFAFLGKALKAIKELIWGAKKAPDASTSMLGQLRFSARILTDLPGPIQGLKTDMAETVLHHSAAFGTSEYLQELREAFFGKVVVHINDTTDAGVMANRMADRDHAMVTANTVTRSFAAVGLLNTMQEVSTFDMVVASLMTEAEFNTNSLAQIQEIYDHVIQNIKVEDFRENADPTDQNDIHQAQQKFNALQGNFGVKTDKQGRSSLLPSFLALSLINERFRETLAGMTVPDRLKDQSSTVDGHLTNLGNAAMDRLGEIVSNDQTDRNLQARIDALVSHLVANVGDQRSFIEKTIGGNLDKADKLIADYIQKITDPLAEKAERVIRTSRSRLARGGARGVQFATALVNEKSLEILQGGLTKALNQGDGLRTIRRLVSDVIGRTSENAPVFDMISRVRAFVQQLRQQFREDTPRIIAGEFSRKVTSVEWSTLHKVFGKTDLASLRQVYGIAGSLDLLADARKLTREVKRLETQVQTLAGVRAAGILTKAQQLAHYLNTGEHGVRLLRNAYAVAHLFGERGRVRPGQADTLVEPVDQLITLYAIQGLSQNTRDTLQDLLDNERQGLEFALSYLVGLRAQEHVKAGSTRILANQYKGYIPSEQQHGVSLTVALDSDHARLVERGYIRVAPYTGSSADRGAFRKSYYFAPVSGRATFNQGVMQTVHQTVNGIDPRTGFTLHEMTAGRITDPQVIRSILSQISYQQATRENLLPVFDENGQVVALERGVDVQQLSRLNRDTDLSKMIGVWKGRQVEEVLAQETNAELVGRLHDIWSQGQQDNRSGEFINLARLPKSADPVLHEAWRLVPDQTKDLIDNTFGKGEFWVRRDMLEDAVGYRQASVGDLFTGETRWKPSVQKAFQDFALTVFGNNAYARLVKSEQLVQDLVSNAKVLIVVKSVVVPAANLMSNVAQLLIRGVPAQHIIRGLGRKTTELNSYIKWRHEEVDLEARLQAAKGANDLVQIRKIDNRLTAIKDATSRLSIWPLIEAGEFSAISNGMVTAEDLALAEGRWGNWAEQLAAKAPEGLRTPIRYAMVTRDTALFQGLNRAVQYGDFLGKAILYEDLTKRKKVAKKDALIQISEEFVNYNRLAGRSRGYAESVGLLWFPNFKLRSVKVAASMLRHQPLRSLLFMNMLLGGVDSPLNDNLVNVTLEDRLGYSIGPQMGLHAFSLNPWMNLIH